MNANVLTTLNRTFSCAMRGKTSLTSYYGIDRPNGASDVPPRRALRGSITDPSGFSVGPSTRRVSDRGPTRRRGTTLAPKLLKETANDLMFAVSAGAARQYGQKELWACADLWFWDKFPEKGKAGPGYHTPDQLYARGAHIFRRPPIFFSRAFLPCSWWIKPSRGSATFPRLGSWIRHVRRKIRLAMVRAISLCPWHGMNDCRQRRNPARTAPKILAKNGC